MNDSATVAATAAPRRTPRFGRSMLPVFAALTAALLALALLIAQTIVAQRDARELATNEGETLLTLNELMSAMLNAETGQRGYLLTERAEYLKPYLVAKAQRDRAMNQLRRVSARSPDTAFPENIARLDRMADAKFAEMDRSLALAQAGFRDQALALTQADFGKMQMDALRREITQLNLRKAERRRDAFVRAGALERLLLPLIGVLGLTILGLIYAGFRAERSRSLAQAEAEQAAALREANQRAELLARELNHRVKNLFSVILSIVSLSGRKQASSREVVDDIRARIRALALAHSASQGGQGGAVELGAVVTKTMEPYADAGRERVRIGGPAVELPARMVTPLGLIVHELATNAVKYGALSSAEGTVDIRWELAPGAPAPDVSAHASADTDAADWLTLHWIERGGPPVDPATPEKTTGFGSQMTLLAADQLGGSLEREWPTEGAVVRLKLPLA